MDALKYLVFIPGYSEGDELHLYYLRSLVWHNSTGKFLIFKLLGEWSFLIIKKN